MRVFLLSPANASGIRMQMLLRPAAQFDLAQRLRRGEATLGEAFEFTSGLYFRGKRAYARTFGAAAYVIAPGAGLVPEGTRVTVEHLLEMGRVPIDLAVKAYLEPLERAARLLKDALPQSASIVLLGSIATAKYVEPLLKIFGARLLFPPSFVGRGDMSRGGLLLRCVRSGEELEYAPVEGAVRHGPRPAKLPRAKR